MTVIAGERVPNFMRHDHTGQPVTLYQDFCARRVVLISPLRDAIDYRQMEELVGPGDGPGDDHGDEWALVALLRGSPADIAAQAARMPASVCVLADDSAVTDFLAGPEGAPFSLILDRNFRVLARRDLAQTERAHIAAVYRSAPTVSHPPALIVPAVLDAALCGQLIDAYRESNEPSGVMRMEAGRLVYAEDSQVKIRREHRLTRGPLWEALEQRLQRCLLPEIKWAFNYEVTHFEGVKVVAYQADHGGFFSPHRDNDGDDTAHRRFAMTINLNPDEYAGGELSFPEYGDDGFQPAIGSAIVFSCNLAHEARPVIRGTRYALVSFFYSRDDTLHAATYENRVADR